MTLVVDVPGDAAAVRAELAPVAERLELLISVREVTAPGAYERRGSRTWSAFMARIGPGIVHR